MNFKKTKDLLKLFKLKKIFFRRTKNLTEKKVYEKNNSTKIFDTKNFRLKTNFNNNKIRQFS